MPDQLYIQPLTLAPSPQEVDGDAVRLAGGLADAHRFAVPQFESAELLQCVRGGVSQVEHGAQTSLKGVLLDHVDLDLQ